MLYSQTAYSSVGPFCILATKLDEAIESSRAYSKEICPSGRCKCEPTVSCCQRGRRMMKEDHVKWTGGGEVRFKSSKAPVQSSASQSRGFGRRYGSGGGAAC